MFSSVDSCFEQATYYRKSFPSHSLIAIELYGSGYLGVFDKSAMTSAKVELFGVSEEISGVWDRLQKAQYL